MRYHAAMLGLATDNRQYGNFVFSVEAQAIYLRFCEKDDLAQQLLDGLITVEESARLSDDIDLLAFLGVEVER